MMEDSMMEHNNRFVIEFQSRCWKNKKHNNCSNQWTGFGFTVSCICHCHRNADKKILSWMDRLTLPIPMIT